MPGQRVETVEPVPLLQSRVLLLRGPVVAVAAHIMGELREQAAPVGVALVQLIPMRQRVEQSTRAVAAVVRVETVVTA